MKTSSRLVRGAVLSLAFFSIFPLCLRAQSPAPPAPDVAFGVDIEIVMQRINAKARSGQYSEAALADELRTLDALIARGQEQKNDDQAGMLRWRKAMLYLDLFNKQEEGLAMLVAIKTELPGSAAAAQADRTLEKLERRAQAEKVKAALAGQRAPALNFTWSSRKGLKSLADLKGKVVVLDFWTTSCGPCVAAFPQLRELTDRYQGFDVVVLGVTSLQGRVHRLPGRTVDCRNDPEKETALMNEFIKAKEMTWPVVFTAENVFNPEYGVTGIPHVTIIAPDGIVRHSGLGGHGEKTAKIDAILKEFGLKTP